MILLVAPGERGSNGASRMHCSSRLPCYDFHHDSTEAIAAANITTAVAQPSTFIQMPLVRSPMASLLLATSMMTTSNGGERKPLITAVQKRALIGLMPMKLISVPMAVEMAMAA